MFLICSYTAAKCNASSHRYNNDHKLLQVKYLITKDYQFGLLSSCIKLHEFQKLLALTVPDSAIWQKMKALRRAEIS